MKIRIENSMSFEAAVAAMNVLRSEKNRDAHNVPVFKLNSITLQSHGGGDDPREIFATISVEGNSDDLPAVNGHGFAPLAKKLIDLLDDEE